jgi:glycosyltransferase involved in cell wall biosynthesis
MFLTVAGTPPPFALLHREISTLRTRWWLRNIARRPRRRPAQRAKGGSQQEEHGDARHAARDAERLMPPKLTVLLTTYNHERHIEKALESALNQVTNFRFEIVVIEDRSTDGTRAAVERYAARFPRRIRMALNDTTEASNRRFAHEYASCTSEYIAMLDGDDYWTSVDKLQRQVDLMEAWPECTLSFHDVLAVPDGLPGDPWRHTGVTWPTVAGIEDLWLTNPIAGCAAVVRKAALPELPHWYEDASWGDYPLYLLQAERGTVVYLDDVLGVYRVHPEGYWSRHTEEEKIEQLIAFYEEMRIHFPEYTASIDAQIKRKETTLERAKIDLTALLRRWRLSEPVDHARLDAVVANHVPDEAALVRLQPLPETRSTRSGVELVYPPPSSAREQLFTKGSDGTARAPWLTAGRVYEFRLCDGADPSVLLDTVTVAKAASPAEADALSGDAAVLTGQPYVTATPRVPWADGAATTCISWSTADGSLGAIYVVVYPFDANVPHDDRTAVACLERVIGAGAEFLLVPAFSLWWLDVFSGMAAYLTSQHRLLFADETLCRLYQLKP